MIERLYVKNHLSFEEAELSFSPGLSVFTGVSGAGKSVLMNAILAVFGLGESEASVIEADVLFKFDMNEFGIANEDINNFRFFKDKSTRYFINSQSISKKNISIIASQHIKFLGSKNQDELSSNNLLYLLDEIMSKKDIKHKLILLNLNKKFIEFKKVKKDLLKIEEEERKIEELKEFAKFEIEKIQNISPKKGEYEKLNDIKKRLSKKDKINEAWEKANQIFMHEKSVVDALAISNIDGCFFEDAMNELRAAKESINMEELDDLDIENILNRIEDLSSLNKRYGSIDEALLVLEKRKKELEHYEKITFEKENLLKIYNSLNNEILSLAKIITINRNNVKKDLEIIINSYLNELYMSNILINLSNKVLDYNGMDEVSISMGGAEFKNLSSGETNRLRLAFIAAGLEILNLGNGVLILDEIDANLSGKEAMSIANVLVKISKFYQIFAISHQPQLSSKAHNHFLVIKKGNNSLVKKLNEEEKVAELARMISGETVTKEAVEFAKKLRNY